MSDTDDEEQTAREQRAARDIRLFSSGRDSTACLRRRTADPKCRPCQTDNPERVSEQRAYLKSVDGDCGLERSFEFRKAEDNLLVTLDAAREHRLLLVQRAVRLVFLHPLDLLVLFLAVDDADRLEPDKRTEDI